MQCHRRSGTRTIREKCVNTDRSGTERNTANFDRTLLAVDVTVAKYVGSDAQDSERVVEDVRDYEHEAAEEMGKVVGDEEGASSARQGRWRCPDLDAVMCRYASSKRHAGTPLPDHENSLLLLVDFQPEHLVICSRTHTMLSEANCN